MAITNIEKIKPIPKYILKKIESLDKKLHQSGSHLRFYAYLAIWKKNLVKITVAVKHKHDKWYYKQVAVHSVHGKKCIVKDIEYAYMGGYRVGWFEQGLTKAPYWYESTMWYSADNKYYDPYAPIVNKNLIDKFPEYKYSAYKQYPYEDLLKYLRMYEQYPQTEYLVKLGLYSLASSIMILKQIGKDKRFRNWITTHREELKGGYYYFSTILLAYKMKKSLAEAQTYERRKKQFCHEREYKPIRELFRGKLGQFFSYIDEQEISYRLYLDYLTACNYLQLDMTENKNRIPHDFQRWHDIRIDQYHTAKALKDAEERKELYAKFAIVAEKYLSLQRNMNDAFIVIIAKSPQELIREGDILHHCVGRMNYDQKFAREESLIFFVRNANEPDTPFVTLEYSLKNKKILQCYGEHNRKPDDGVMEFVNKKWLPYANRHIKQIAA